jgi:hypothetical protein
MRLYATVFSLFLLNGVNLSQAEDTPTLYIGVSVGSGNVQLDEQIMDLAYDISKHLVGAGIAATPQRLSSWNLEKQWEGLRQHKYTHFVVLRPPTRQIQATGDGVDIDVDIGFLSDTGVPFWGTLARVIHIDPQGTIKNGIATMSEADLRDEIVASIERLLPELGDSYLYYLKCFDSTDPENPSTWDADKAQFSAQLWRRLRDLTAEKLRPLGEFTMRSCSADGNDGQNPLDADLVFAPWIVPAGVKGAIRWQIEIEVEAQIRRNNRKGLINNDFANASPEFTEKILKWHNQMDRPPIEPLTVVVGCTKRTFQGVNYAPAVTKELANTVKMRYLFHLEYSRSPDWNCSP